jgi:type IV secretory pathway VirJ component
VGYSFGAGALPFAYDHLIQDAKARRELSPLGLATAADVEIRIRRPAWRTAQQGPAGAPGGRAPIDPALIQQR